MKTENLVYSLIQIFHNLDGALAMGAPLFWLYYEPVADKTRKALLLLLLVWGLQGVSGALFSVASYSLYGAFPELNMLAEAVLYVKIACVILAFSTCSFFLYKKTQVLKRRIFLFLFILGATGQIAAALLRWNS